MSNSTKNYLKNHFTNSFSEELWSQSYKYFEDNNLSDTFRRVARAVAQAEKTKDLQLYWEDKFYDMLSDFKVTVGGRVYTNAGTKWDGATLLNCFVSPKPRHPLDSLEGIYENLLFQASTLKSEGGWGCNFSVLRPRGSFIKKIGITSPGVVKFMELFDKSSEIITSGAIDVKTNIKEGKIKVRKGAMMGILDIWHPDIIEFISAKQIPGRLTKFNISINCTNKFMNIIEKINILKEQNADKEEIEKIDKWELIFPDTTDKRYDCDWDGDIEKWINEGHKVIVHKTVSASWLWDLIMKSTYERAEPGIVFLDRANEFFATNYLDKIVATNPCGEQCLPYGGSCNLGSLNLTQMIKENDDGSVEVDFDKIKYYGKLLVRFLDDVNDITKLPLPDYKIFVETRRRIGCGIMGWGSLLYMLRIPFGSKKANELRDKIMSTYARACYEASIDLAIEKGSFIGCFPEKHVETKYIKMLGLSKKYLDKLRKYGIRNSAILSCQPTGNTGIFANLVSGGIEPVFMPEYIRTVIVPEIPEHIKDYVPKFWEGEFKETELFKFDKEGNEVILKGIKDNIVYKIDKNRGLTKEVLCEDYGVRWLKERNLWDPNADWAVTALNLPVSVHLNDLNGFSRWVDSSISKTINVPYDYPFDDFKNIYLTAYKSGFIKGVTTYRTGTMMSVLSEKTDEEIIYPDIKLPNDCPAYMKILRADGKKWYLFLVTDSTTKRIIALFVHTNHPEKNIQTFNSLDLLFDLAKRKGIPQKYIESTQKKITSDSNPTKIARTIGLLLRHGVSPKSIVNELYNIDVPVTSFIYQIRKFLSAYIKDGEKLSRKCDSCGQESLVYQEGCIKCMSCGMSLC